MLVSDLLTVDRIKVIATRSGASLEKAAVIRELAHLLAKSDVGEQSLPEADIVSVLEERESLQSTGIGEGVAIPHGSHATLATQRAALLIVPDGVRFGAIDGLDVTILLAVIGPTNAAGEHLKTLARVSRVFRSHAFRGRLLAAQTEEGAFGILRHEES